MKRTDWLYFSIHILLVFIFFWPVFGQGKLPVPTDTLVGLYHPWRDMYASEYPRGRPFKNFLITDPVRQQIPWRKLVIDAYKSGKFPSWNPYSFSGTSLAANIQAGAFYPLNILFFLFSFPTAWTILIVVQPLLSGLFMYWYLRQMGLIYPASLLGSIAWSMSGFQIAWLTWGTIGHAGLWLPLALGSLDTLIKLTKSKRAISWVAVLSLALAMSALAGHAQIALYVWIFSGIYALVKISALPVLERRRPYVLVVGAVLFAALSVSVQWVPFMQEVLASGRSLEQGWLKDGWFFPWQNLVQFLAPDFFGNPATLNYWGTWNYGELVGYIGVLPLLFAFSTLVSPDKNYVRLIRFWIGVIVGATLLMTPWFLMKTLYALNIPFYGSLQPTRLLFLVDFALSVCAAVGVQQFLSSRVFSKTIWFFGILFVLLWITVIVNPLNIDLVDIAVSRRNLIFPSGLYVLGVLGAIGFQRLRKRRAVGDLIVWLFIGVSALELLRFGWKFTPFTDPVLFFPTTKTIAFLKNQPRPFRIASLDRRLLPPNVGAFYGIESIEGYDPIIRRRYEEFIASSERRKPDIVPPFGFDRIITPHAIDSPLFRLLGVRYILSLEDRSDPFLTEVFREGETRVYQFSAPIERVTIIGNTLYEDSSQEFLNRVYSNAWDIETSAVVEDTLSLQDQPVGPSEGVEITEYSDSSIRFQVTLDTMRLIRITNMFDSGWQAFVDGDARWAGSEVWILPGENAGRRTTGVKRMLA
ncbi:MAG: YfhO family protein, partial [bacterium]|nr:YfhO family protein [bacterium]